LPFLLFINRLKSAPASIITDIIVEKMKVHKIVQNKVGELTSLLKIFTDSR